MITRHMIVATLSSMLSCNTPKTSIHLLLSLSSLKSNSVQMFLKNSLLSNSATLCFLTRRLKDGNERVTKLAELNAPDILLANERALLCKNVESLEDNEHTPKPDRNIDGHVCASLHDIGYSILDGWLNKNDSAFESDGKNNSGYDPDKLAALVKKAIGTRTQEQFSQTSHLGRVYVNRLANGKTQSQPTEVTLKKIAKATDVVTENELRQACGYEPLPGEDVVESKKRIETVDDCTWIRENVNYFLLNS